MSGSNEAPRAVDESFLLAEALERALSNVDEPRSLTVPALAELPSLFKLARRVETSAHAVVPSEDFRVATRARLVASMRAAAEASTLSARQARRQPAPQPRRLRLAVSAWFARVAAALSAVALAGAATATASAAASALPGDPLYVIKQASEQVALDITPDDTARQHVLLQQAEVRLDETSRLLEQGRDAEAGQNAVRYSESLERTATTGGADEPVETRLSTDQTRLISLLAEAPPRARPGLQRALETAQRGLARARRTPDVELDVPAPTAITVDAEVDAPKAAAADEGGVEQHEFVEPRAEQSRHDAPSVGVEGGHAAGRANKPADPPERTEPSTPPERTAPSGPPERAEPGTPRGRPDPKAQAVDNPRGAPPTQVLPAPRGRP